MNDIDALKAAIANAVSLGADDRARLEALVAGARVAEANELQKLEALCVRHRIKVSIDGYVRSSDAAKLLGIEPGTLRNWRHKGDGYGPKFDKGRSDSGHCRYELRELAAWRRGHENK